MTDTAEIVQLGLGDTVPMGTVLANLILMGIVTDINNPNMFAATLEAFQSQAVLTVPVLQGPKGDRGEATFALRWQNDGKTDPSQLDTDLGDTDADVGKYWVFGVEDENGNVVATTMYVWWGTALGFKQLPVGTPGPPGPYPLITPIIHLEVPGSGNGPGGVDSWIHPSGPVSNPQFEFHIAAPQGVAGPSAALGSCPDVDFTTRAPQAGDTLICTARVTPGVPTGLGITPHTTGGTLPAGPYFYKVTATMTNGETLGSNEVTATTTGSTSSIALNWTAPAGGGATGYKIYRGTAIGAQNKLVGIVTDGATTTFTDDNSSTTPATIASTGIFAGRNIWAPTPPVDKYPMPFTIPEAAFTPQAGITASTPVTIMTYDMPKQPWKFKPWLTGQIQMFGANLSLTPLLVGVEVRLGDPTTGSIVARGFSNSQGYVTFIPHTSDADHPSAAMTATNAYGLVQANHAGTTGTLYLNVVNVGMAGVFDVLTDNAQLGGLQLPVPQ